MKRKGEEMMRKEKMEKKDAAWRKNNQGMGTVEMILIIVVLIGLVLIFKTQIAELTSTVFEKISADSSAILA